MKNKNYAIKTSRYSAIFIAVFAMLFWVNYEVATPEAIKVATNKTLSPSEQFSAMSSLAYYDKKDPQALFLLYSMLYHGHGTPTSPETALHLLKKSANAGFGPAQEELAFIYLEGNEHYKKDKNKAYHWLKKASRSGMVKSQEHLKS